MSNSNVTHPRSMPPRPCPHPKRKRVELIVGATVYVRCSWCFGVLSERGLYDHGDAMPVYTTMTRDEQSSPSHLQTRDAS
jgi:hypothetical protein